MRGILGTDCVISDSVAIVTLAGVDRPTRALSTLSNPAQEYAYLICASPSYQSFGSRKSSIVSIRVIKHFRAMEDHLSQHESTVDKEHNRKSY